jgi:2-polyprenyl-6-methoxyphenol hydroxylase-like FAD-dependent oxidoreductase
MQAEARTCVIAGGGPAGMMLGLLLARAGIQVLVLEKHADFLRDFRGDTVHASTVRLLDELGLGDRFRALPQSQLRGFELPGPDGSMTVIADFRTLRPPYNYVAMVPQWDLLSLLADAARCEPQFELQMEREVVDLLTDGGRTVGVRTRSSAGEVAELRCDLVVGCDGRDSVVRRRAGLVPRAYQVPFDTWWFRLPRDSGPAPQEDRLQPRFGRDEILLSIPRPGYFQLAYIAAKNADRRIAEEGIEKFRARIGQLRPDLADRVGGIASLHDLHHLDVKLDRLRTWHRDGVLCIGDAAHAMSPAGGVGINLAIQDAVAAARLLVEPMRHGPPQPRDLARVRRRRWMPTVIMQTVQRILHYAVFGPIVSGQETKFPPLARSAISRIPGFGIIPARLVALGPLPEHAPRWARR